MTRDFFAHQVFQRCHDVQMNFTIYDLGSFHEETFIFISPSSGILIIRYFNSVNYRLFCLRTVYGAHLSENILIDCYYYRQTINFNFSHLMRVFPPRLHENITGWGILSFNAHINCNSFLMRLYLTSFKHFSWFTAISFQRLWFSSFHFYYLIILINIYLVWNCSKSSFGQKIIFCFQNQLSIWLWSKSIIMMGIWWIFDSCESATSQAINSRRDNDISK